ncbi:CFI-box-CTERM domain-containing protein [Suilimivivens sp.]|uniref:CFI-box-CTERM domain-containing protein n=1 Tax=Suilimivivens sp. TaxID=2981669 RepID=UPI00307B7A3D
MTTACCGYKGLPDDCEELTVMRAFRDNYLSKTPVGRRCIQIYYEEAPRIVNQIEKSPFRDKILEEIYQEVCELKKIIEKGKNEDVLSRYLLLMMQADEKSRETQEKRNND